MRRIALIGAPTDSNSSFLRGPAKAPPLIRAALFSDMGNPAAECGLELGAGIDLVDHGDLPIDETPADDARITEGVARILAESAVPLILGGDHAITFPAFRAVAAAFGPVNILHFDAHADIYDDFAGNPRSHASPFARIMERGLAKRLVQVGIRTLNAHPCAQVERFGVEVIPMRGFRTEHVPVLEGPTYISFDLDGLDPAFAPGVSHHEPGGISVREALDVLARQSAPIVGADIVEYNPDRDINGMTAAVAAKLVKEIAALATVNGASSRA